MKPYAIAAFAFGSGAALMLAAIAWVPFLQPDCAVVVIRQTPALVKYYPGSKIGKIELRPEVREIVGRYVIHLRYGHACVLRMGKGA